MSFPAGTTNDGEDIMRQSAWRRGRKTVLGALAGAIITAPVKALVWDIRKALGFAQREEVSIRDRGIVEVLDISDRGRHKPLGLLWTGGMF